MAQETPSTALEELLKEHDSPIQVREDLGLSERISNSFIHTLRVVHIPETALSIDQRAMVVGGAIETLQRHFTTCFEARNREFPLQESLANIHLAQLCHQEEVVATMGFATPLDNLAAEQTLASIISAGAETDMCYAYWQAVLHQVLALRRHHISLSSQIVENLGQLLYSSKQRIGSTVN